ncbi:3-hydroxyacyl-CoA dehydrogenase NAD-binding domain-containing protein [Sphingobium sp.]|uniref:3-hydroxyacyl-CoA dehydrogenase NAD-binding domain-containing protein n=1 Tax=Sphingobium sp. TaxID=1912891 RepID=UPI002C2B38FB|nr:3-hydroxyacyl-CoA dehydrogenase NAD-binding domain-containing protein [Sphingobium sp.]HUD92690.1 3-hydroxyacyl-CoA dehydrogenase NAD-binding domain-containing protein [Sphingobium sp.]
MTAINEGTDLTLEDGVAIVTLDFPPVNAMSPMLTNGLYDAFMAALADPAAKAIVLICAGRTFIAGADLKSMGKVPPKVDFFELQDAIENSPKPTIAAMHGTPLGGGLETAMTLHYRIATPDTHMGLPEVNLGLLPGGGGTQRMPRITGAEAALDLMLTGRQVSAKDALAVGLIDRIASDGASLRADAIAFARQLIDQGNPPQRIRDRQDKVAADRADPGLMDRLHTKWASKMKGLDAPQAIFRCVAAAVTESWDKSIAFERAEFQKVLTGPQSAALRHMFMAERTAAKIPGLPGDIALRPVRTVAVIGGGTMGSGIAAAFLDAGFLVTMVEMNQEALDHGAATAKSIFTSRAERGKLTQENADARCAALSTSLDLASAVADADLVVEAVFENMVVKKQLFRELSATARPDAILASNTSFLDVNEIASAATHPERVLGLHFFSPAHVMRLLEIVQAEKTADDVLATAMSLAKKLRKTAVVSGVCHGFIGNRMLTPRQAQANAMLAEGVTPWDIDAALIEFGFAMGPFQMFDLAGLDIGESKHDPVRSALVAAGRKGQKNGLGYYDYSAGRQGKPDLAALDIIEQVTGVKPGEKKLDAKEIVDRLLFPMINEGAKILEEGIALRASDIDVVYVAGYGWPSHKGGPMFHADRTGLAKVVDALRTMPGVTVSPMLEKLAAEGGKFNG